MIFDKIDTSKLYQPFFQKSVQLAANCAARGASYVALSGLRTYDQQNALYSQGRTTPGKIVTQARGGESPHNFCIAIDWALDVDSNKPGLQASWATNDYKILAEEAVKLGLEAGYYWHFQDAGHIQLPVSAHGIKWSVLDAKYKLGGYPEVFKYLDTFKW